MGNFNLFVMLSSRRMQTVREYLVVTSNVCWAKWLSRTIPGIEAMSYTEDRTTSTVLVEE